MLPDTSSALFGAWCPIATPPHAVEGHLATLARLIQIEWPEAEIAPPVILRADA
jgi:hypothetical protein